MKISFFIAPFRCSLLFAALALTAEGFASPLPDKPFRQPKAADRSEQPADTSAQILERMNEEINRKSLELNRLVYDAYLKVAERGRVTPNVYDFPEVDMRAIRDTVPAIAQLSADYLRADSLYTLVLATYPDYESIHREYIALRGVDDKERDNKNKADYNLMYRDLRDHNPAYQPAYEQRLEARRLRNMAVLQLLIDYYRAQGIVMPTEPLIAASSFRAGERVEMPMLRLENPRIATLEEELSILRRLRRELTEQRERWRYGLPEKVQPDSKNTLPSQLDN